MSPSVSAAAAPADPRAVELLRITLAALNARPMFRIGHVGDHLPIRNSYELASAIEKFLARLGGEEVALTAIAGDTQLLEPDAHRSD